MKKIIAVILFLFLASVVSISGAWAQNGQGHNDDLYNSRFNAYTAYFPIEPGPEKGKIYRNLDNKNKVVSYITAEYESEELGTYIKYSIDLEPLDEYKPYKDAVEEKVNEIIDFYEENYHMRVANLENHGDGRRWGTDIIIEFFDGDIPEEELTADDRPWVIRRFVFYEMGHVVVLEAMGSENYVYSEKTDDFFDRFSLNSRL